ncbi:MAG: hypothetical protein KDI50_12460, partial [Candidatus Competibacteraceae bacterium]|nr:hypothetical protein [Candidatus Competibacteraceae bacterium]
DVLFQRLDERCPSTSAIRFADKAHHMPLDIIFLILISYYKNYSQSLWYAVARCPSYLVIALIWCNNQQAHKPQIPVKLIFQRAHLNLWRNSDD